MESMSYNCIQLYILAALSIASSVLIRFGVNWAWLQGFVIYYLLKISLIFSEQLNSYQILIVNEQQNLLITIILM